MKIKCIKNMTDGCSGVFGIGISYPEVISGITLGKVYDAEVINMVSGNGNHNSTQFMIYDDNKEWTSFDLNLFEPA